MHSIFLSSSYCFLLSLLVFSTRLEYFMGQRRIWVGKLWGLVSVVPFLSSCPGSPELHPLSPQSVCECLLVFQSCFVWIKENLQVKIFISQYLMLCLFIKLLQSLPAFDYILMLSGRLIFSLNFSRAYNCYLQESLSDRSYFSHRSKIPIL